MAKKGDARSGITLVCTETGMENYRTTKNRRNTPGRLEIKKYCPKLGKVTLHREKK